MATRVGDVDVRIGADRSELRTGLSAAKAEFTSFANDMQSRADKLSGAIGGALKTAVMAGGAAAVAGATLGLKSYMDLESAAADAAAKAVDVSGKSVSEIKSQYDRLKNHVMAISRELGASTVFDPTQVAGAFQEIAGAGYDVSRVGSEQLRPFLDLAASDMQYGLVPATKLAMSTINQFGLTIEDSARVADVLAKGAAGSGAGLEDFSYALRYVGPVAKATNVSLEETIAMIGLLADKGYRGEMAGAALRSSMLDLSSVTEKGAAVLEKLGLTYDDVDPSAHGFLETLELLKERGASVFDFETLFGKEQAPIIQALSGMTEEVRTFTTELEKSSGVARVMADLKLDSLAGDLEEARGAASDLFIQIGKNLEPTARDILRAFSDIAPEITKAIGKVKFSDLQRSAQTAFRVIAGAAGIGLVVKGLGTIGPAAMAAARYFAVMAVTAAIEFGGVAASAAAARLAIVSTWAAALAPVAGVTAGVALVAAGLAALGYALNPDKFTTFGKVASDAFNGIKSVVTDVYNLIAQGDFSGAANRLKQAFGDGIEYVKGLPWKALGDEVVEMVGDGARAVIDSAFKLGDWIYQTGKRWVDGGGPKRLGEDIIDTLVSAAQSLLKGQDLWSALKSAFKTTQDWLSLGWEIIKGIGSGILGKIKEYLAPAQNQFLDFVKSIGDSFFTLGENIAIAIGNGIDEAGRRAAAFVSWIGQNVPGAAAALSTFGIGTSAPAAPATYQGSPIYTREQLRSMGVDSRDIIGRSDKDQYYESVYGGEPVYRALVNWGIDDSKKQDKIANVLGEMYAVTGETHKGIQAVAINTFASSRDLSAIKTLTTAYERGVASGLIAGPVPENLKKDLESKGITVGGPPSREEERAWKLGYAEPEDVMDASDQLRSATNQLKDQLKVDKSFQVEWESISDGLTGTLQNSKTAFDNFIDSQKWAIEAEKAGAQEEVNTEVSGTRLSVDILKEGIFDTSVNFSQVVGQTTNSMAQRFQSMSEQLAARSEAGARAIQLGSEVASRIHQSGIQNAVTLYQNANGQVCAAIGSVGMQFQQAGQTASQTQISTANQVSGYSLSTQNQISSLQLSNANQTGAIQLSKTTQAGDTFISKSGQAGDSILTKSQAAASALEGAGQRIFQLAGTWVMRSTGGGLFDLGSNPFGGGIVSGGYGPKAARATGAGGSLKDASIVANNMYFEDSICQVDEWGMTPGLGQSLINAGVLTPSYGYTYSGPTAYIGSISGSKGVVKLGRYANTGIAKTPQLAKIAEGEPEVVLTRSKFWEMMGDLPQRVGGAAGGGPVVVQVFLGTEEVTDWIMRRVVRKAHAKGMRF